MEWLKVQVIRDLEINPRGTYDLVRKLAEEHQLDSDMTHQLFEHAKTFQPSTNTPVSITDYLCLINDTVYPL
jgi:hypothetical protein